MHFGGSVVLATWDEAKTGTVDSFKASQLLKGSAIPLLAPSQVGKVSKTNFCRPTYLQSVFYPCSLIPAPGSLGDLGWAQKRPKDFHPTRLIDHASFGAIPSLQSFDPFLETFQPTNFFSNTV